MNRNKTVDYIEFRANDLPAIKQFYNQVFAWEFVDYGPDYTSFKDGRIAGIHPGSGRAGRRTARRHLRQRFFPRRKNRSKMPGGKSPKTSSLFPEDRASTLPIRMGTNWPWTKVDVGYTPTGKGFGEDSSALALPIRMRSNLPSSKDIRPVYQ